MDQQNDTGTPKSIREYVDKFMHRQSKLLLAAVKSQQATNDAQLKRRYANYKTTPLLRQRNTKKANDFSDIDHNCVTAPGSIAHILVEPRPLQPAVLAAKKWIKDPANGDYIRMVEAGEREIIDSVQEIDLSPYVETTRSGITYFGDTRQQRRVKVTPTSTDHGGAALTLSRQPHKYPSSMDFGKRGTPSPTWSQRGSTSRTSRT